MDDQPNMRSCQAINHMNAECVAFVDFGLDERQLGVFRSNMGWEVILAELNGENGEPAELDRVRVTDIRDAMKMFQSMLAVELQCG